MKELNNAIFNFRTLEDLADNRTIIHRLNPLTKLLTTIFYVIIVVSFKPYSISALIPFIFYPIVLMALSETPYKPLLARLIIAVPFCLFAGISNLLLDRNIAFMLFNIPIPYGLLSFISIMLKTLLTVLAILILIATTSMPMLSRQLILLKIPAFFVLLLSMVYRYISVLIEESINIYTAYLLRSGEQKGVRMKDMGNLLGQLIIRTMDRSERIYAAMKCRGFSGDYSYISTKKLPNKEVFYMIILAAIFLFFRIFNPAMIAGTMVTSL